MSLVKLIIGQYTLLQSEMHLRRSKVNIRYLPKTKDPILI